MSVVYSLRYIGCALLLSTFSFDVVSEERENYFNCSLDGGAPFQPGDFGIFITPYLEVVDDVNVKVVFDSRSQLMCRPLPGFNPIDISITWPSELDNSIQGRFRGAVYDSPGNSYHHLPLSNLHWMQRFARWDEVNEPMRLITELNSDGRPLGETASGIIIKAGQRIASYTFFSSYIRPGDGLGLNTRQKRFKVYVHAKSDVVLPFRGCDVSSAKVNVTLGDYPLDVSDKEVNLSVKCPTTRQVSFSLSGNTLTETIFSNVAPISPAKGVGIQLVRDNKPVLANTKISMGSVGKEYVSLGLKARYALDRQPVRVRVRAGNVQAVIGVNFTYN